MAQRWPDYCMRQVNTQHPFPPTPSFFLQENAGASKNFRHPSVLLKTLQKDLDEGYLLHTQCRKHTAGDELASFRDLCIGSGPSRDTCACNVCAYALMNLHMPEADFSGRLHEQTSRTASRCAFCVGLLRCSSLGPRSCRTTRAP